MKFLKKTREYKEVYSNCHKREGRFFLALFNENGNPKEFAVGVTVSKKVGKACARNFVKRRIKAFLRSRDLGYLGGLNVVIVSKTKAATVGWDEFVFDLDGVFRGLESTANH